MVTQIPAGVSALLQEITDRLRVILGTNLVGIYLYGSLTQGAFNPKHSDIDCIVVTRRGVSEGQFKKLESWLARAAASNAWARRLQVTFLIKNEILGMGSEACLYQFGRLERMKSDGNPIIWMNVLENGVTLFGAQPQSFVPPITKEILFEALKREVGYLREEIITKPDSEWRDVPFYRVYAVLTLCRILYSFKKGTVVSKPRAARWALKYLPREWNAIITQALNPDAEGHSRNVPLSAIRRFINFADAQLH